MQTTVGALFLAGFYDGEAHTTEKMLQSQLLQRSELAVGYCEKFLRWRSMR
jgi:hypothetical protein